MSCGCKNQSITVTPEVSVNSTNPNCELTKSYLEQLREQLYCIKEKELYQETNSSEALINSYLGTVISALYYPSDYCYFQPSLDTIIQFIQTLTILPCANNL